MRRRSSNRRRRFPWQTRHGRLDSNIRSDMLYADQVLLIGTGCSGDRLGETFLLPGPPRWIFKDGDSAQWLVWSPRCRR
jgi:hypothetical protein